MSSMADDDYGRGYTRHRRHSSMGGTPPMIGRASSHSSYGTPYASTVSIPQMGTPYAQTVTLGGHSNPIPIPGQGSVYGNVPMNSGSYTALPGSYGSSHHHHHRGSSPYTGTTVLPGGTAYASSSYAAQPQYVSSGYGQPQSYTIQGSQYPGGALALPAVPAGSTIIIQQPSRRSRHSSISSHKHHHSRSHSSSDPKRVNFL